MLFKSSIEFKFEIDIPLQKFWEFCFDINNWPKWVDKAESCLHEGELKEGSIVKLKIKNRNLYINIHMVEFKPYKQYKMYSKLSFLFAEENSGTFQVNTENTTTLIFNTKFRSIVPFLRGYLRRKIHRQYLKIFELIKNEMKENA